MFGRIELPLQSAREKKLSALLPFFLMFGARKHMPVSVVVVILTNICVIEKTDTFSKFIKY